MDRREGVMNQYPTFCYRCRARSFENRMIDLPDVPSKRPICPNCRSELEEAE